MTQPQLNFKFTPDEMDDIIYAARDVQIRFSRLRKCVKRGDEDVQHWSESECDRKIDHYKNLETKLIAKYWEAFGNDW